MIFGKDRDKGIRLNGLHPEVVTIGEDGVTEADLLVHDEAADEPYLALDAVADVVAGLPGPGRRPAAVGPADPRPAPRGPADAAVAKPAQGDLARVLRGGETWTVE